MCIMCDLLLDAGWTETGQDGTLHWTAKGRSRVVRVIERDLGLDARDPDQLSEGLAALESVLKGRIPGSEREDRAMPDSLALKITEALDHSAALQGHRLAGAIEVPRSLAGKLTEQLREQVEAAKLFGQLPAEVEVGGMDVLGATIDGKDYAWNITAVRAWCQQNRDRWEVWSLHENGLGQYIRQRLMAHSVDMELVTSMTTEQAYATPLVLVPTPGHEEDGAVSAIEGVEAIVRLLMHRRYEAQVVLLTAEESAQFMIVAGA